MPAKGKVGTMTGYIFTHAGQQFAPEGAVDVPDPDAHNKALEAAELAYWAAKPDRFAAYISNKGVTTWRGASLGTITERRRHHNNLGAQIEFVKIRGNNGAIYSGRYGCDWSQLVKLRRVKN